MNFKKLSLRIRIFLSMTLLILLTYVLIAIMTVFQYKEQTKEYNSSRFDRKEDAIRLDIGYVMRNSIYPLETKNIKRIFEKRILEIKSVHKVNIKMYDLKGSLLISSEPIFKHSDSEEVIGYEDLKQLKEKNSHRLTQGSDVEGKSLLASYTYIDDQGENPIGILKLHYLQDNSAQEKDLGEFLYRLGIVYVLMFFTAIIFAYFLSSYITRSLKTIIDKMSETGLDRKNEKIVLGNVSLEIRKLVQAYNIMVDELEESAVKLAKSEREQAWREMAKQVAHEIKNPLTPMRLTVQSFERRFDAADPMIREKLKDYSDTLIQQIDVMSAIASAFSDFAQMPTQRKEMIEVVGVIRMALDIFNKRHINYHVNAEKILVNLDKSQLIRVVTNVIQNAIHATEDQKNPIIELTLLDNENAIEILVSDNGKGIKEDLKNKVFEPRFTTKSSGMGLGLPMIKKILEGYGGSIEFSSKEDVGTIFTICIPKE